MILSGSKLGVWGSLERDEVVSATGMRWRNDVKMCDVVRTAHVGVCNLQLQQVHSCSLQIPYGIGMIGNAFRDRRRM